MKAEKEREREEGEENFNFVSRATFSTCQSSERRQFSKKLSPPGAFEDALKVLDTQLSFDAGVEGTSRISSAHTQKKRTKLKEATLSSPLPKQQAKSEIKHTFLTPLFRKKKGIE